MGQTLPPPRGRGGCQGAGRICEQERGEYPIYIVGGGGLERDPHRPTTTTRPKGGGGGSHIPVLFPRCSLIVIATAEREGKGYLSNPGEGGREGRCLCCLREQQGEEDLAASRAFWGGRERGVDQTARGLRRRPSNALGGWLTRGEFTKETKWVVTKEREKSIAGRI